MYKRIFTIVIDSVGCGVAPKSHLYGDKDVNTIGNLARAVGGVNLPTMQKMGLGNITDIMGVAPITNPTASFGKMDELSNGKDTMTGHWEMMGIYTTKPFKTFTDTGFPKELIDELEERTGRKIRYRGLKQISFHLRYQEADMDEQRISEKHGFRQILRTGTA